MRGQGERPCQAKVGQLEDAGLRDQDVGRLHVPVQDLLAVDEVEAVEQLLHHLGTIMMAMVMTVMMRHLLDLSEVELDVGVAEQPGEVVLGEVEHQVERRLVPVVLARLVPVNEYQPLLHAADLINSILNRRPLFGKSR